MARVIEFITQEVRLHLQALPPIIEAAQQAVTIEEAQAVRVVRVVLVVQADQAITHPQEAADRAVDHLEGHPTAVEGEDQEVVIDKCE